MIHAGTSCISCPTSIANIITPTANIITPIEYTTKPVVLSMELTQGHQCSRQVDLSPKVVNDAAIQKPNPQMQIS